MYLNFMCRSSKKRKDGLSPIELSIIQGEERKMISLNRWINAADFNQKKQKVRKNDDINEYLDAVRTKMFAIEAELIRRNLPNKVSNILDIFYHGFEEANLSLLTLFDRHNADAKKKLASGIITRTTYLKYLCTRKYLFKFMHSELKKKDILLLDITPTFVEQFYVYLTGMMSNNSAVQKMKLLKKILKVAQEDGFIRAMPFRIKLSYDTLEYDTLTIDEIRMIRQKEFDNTRLAQVRDVFVFACYSGLAFTDLKNLTKHDLQTDEQGKEWIIKARHKTQIVSHIPLLPIAKEIWEHYNYQLPVLSNQKYNSYLKEIADCCGIKKTLHTHLARHTFATILLNSGVDMVSVSKILGHANSRITEKTYAKLMPDTIMKRVEAVAERIV